MGAPSAAKFATELDSKWPGAHIPGLGPGTIGQQWLAWYSAHKHAAPIAELEKAFLTDMLVKTLPGVLGGAVSAEVGAVGDIATGVQTASYLPSSPFTGLLAALTSMSTWIRVVKIALGGALLLIGLAHITGAGGEVMTRARNVKVVPV